jgi:hypothetical protein
VREKGEALRFRANAARPSPTSLSPKRPAQRAAPPRYRDVRQIHSRRTTTPETPRRLTPAGAAPPCSPRPQPPQRYAVSGTAYRRGGGALWRTLSASRPLLSPVPPPFLRLFERPSASVPPHNRESRGPVAHKRTKCGSGLRHVTLPFLKPRNDDPKGRVSAFLGSDPIRAGVMYPRFSCTESERCAARGAQKSSERPPVRPGKKTAGERERKSARSSLYAASFRAARTALRVRSFLPPRPRSAVQPAVQRHLGSRLRGVCET